ncbi:MAG: FAD-dependent monooxygenase [Firmicutes bacterium]|nr:FAD-dependent monooxygenase [Bacillota bacterium]
MAPDREMAVIGAGIGGLSFAALYAESHRPLVVYEAADRLDPAGAALAIAPNAAAVLRKMGVADALFAQGSRIDRYRFVRQDGRILTQFSLKNVQTAWKEAAWCVPRAAVQAVLLEAVRQYSTVDLRYGYRLTAVRASSHGTGFALNWANRSSSTAQIVIGADGLHSVVAADINRRSPLEYQGMQAFRGVADYDLPEELQHVMSEVWGNGYAFGYSPMGPGKVYWYATRPADATDCPQDFLQTLQHLFALWPDPVAALIAATPAAAVLWHPLYFYRHPRYLTGSGRIALVGDAAHAMTPNLGQGACQAIMDGWVLQHAWQQEREAAAAFRLYERMRRADAVRIARLSHLAGWITHGQGLRAALRNKGIAALPNEWLSWGARYAIGRPETAMLPR